MSIATKSILLSLIDEKIGQYLESLSGIRDTGDEQRRKACRAYISELNDARKEVQETL
jgi:hypothetical protein